jgi:hypothetical protein
MKNQMKLFFIMLISIAIHCWPCGYSSNTLSSYGPPLKSGTYTIFSTSDKYSDGTTKTIGGGFRYTDWEDTDFYKHHRISCSITNIESNSHYEFGKYKLCYKYTIDCSVTERIQFYLSDVSYTTLQGYRGNGTRKWSRDEPGSTDISCYNNAGMYVTKRVNDPYYCK